MSTFLTDYSKILEQLEKADMSRYGSTRNYLDGAVTRLSPFISRGVLTLPWIRKRLLERLTPEGCERFFFQLTWREFFQRTWWKYGNGILINLRGSRDNNTREGIPKSITEATTGITIIDQQINQLYSTGYVHNHVRMYLSSLACVTGRCDWKIPSAWMYYHLLDGDVASNVLSWQWVAGTFSSKQYVFNQDNLNHYSNTTQRNTFIDVPYEKLLMSSVPGALRELSTPTLTTQLPNTSSPSLDHSKPLLIYNSYNLDPLWEKDIDANRVLLLEPSHFQRFPVSEKVIHFIIKLGANIKGLQVFAGEINELPGIESFPAVLSKEHPAFGHYPGDKTPAQWMFPSIELTPSFSSFWKKCLKVNTTQ